MNQKQNSPGLWLLMVPLVKFPIVPLGEPLKLAIMNNRNDPLYCIVLYCIVDINSPIIETPRCRVELL